MTRETDTYLNERAYLDAQKRGSTRHQAGFRLVSTSRNRLQIVWDDTIIPNKQPRQLTQTQFLNELAEARDVVIT